MPLYRTRHHLRRTGEVDRSGGDLRMAHHARERVEVASAFEPEGGERMPEAVRGKFNSRTVFQFLHEPVHALDAHGRIALGRHEEMVPRLVQALAVGDVFPQERRETGGYGHYAVLVPLPLDHVDGHAAEVHVLGLEVRDLGFPESGENHHGDYGDVALGFEPEGELHTPHGGEEAFRVVGGKGLGQGLGEFRQVDAHRGVLLYLPLLQEVAEEEPDVAVASPVRGGAPVSDGAAVEEPDFYGIARAVGEFPDARMFEIHAAREPHGGHVVLGEVAYVDRVQKALVEEEGGIVHGHKKGKGVLNLFPGKAGGRNP